MATKSDLLNKAPSAGTDRLVLDESTGKATTKKSPAKKAAAKKAPKADGEKVTRNKLGPSGWLQEAILKVCTDFADGKVDTEGKPLTPHRIAKLVEAAGNPLPSSGAVAACLARWDEYGFAVLNEKPVAFKRFTPAGKKKGLETMVAEHRTAAWAARKG
jgi:hypothetical protein